MIFRLLGAQKIFNIKVMVKNYLLDFAYRNICFINFINASVNVWKSIQNNITTKKKDEFLQHNEGNLAVYNTDKLIVGKYTPDVRLPKELKIRQWIRENEIKISPNLGIEETNLLIDVHLFPKLKEKITSLIKEKNLVLQFIFPQVIQNIFDCFILFKEIKVLIFKEIKEESNKYTNLLIDSNEKENSLKAKIKNDQIFIKQMKKKFENQNLKQEEKITHLEELVKKLNSQVELNKKI